MNNIVYLHGQPEPVAQFLRIGSSGHRRLEHFLAAGKLPYQRFVGEAGVFERQKDLVSALRQDGRELVLDTNVAELSAVGRYQGAVQGAPWANPDGVLTETHLRAGNSEFDLIGKIARFVVENGIKRVMHPRISFPKPRTDGCRQTSPRAVLCGLLLIAKVGETWP